MITEQQAKPLWGWMNARHAIYLARENGQPWPWSKDPIFQTYAFCNVFRELDKVTVWIRENWREPFADHPNLWWAMAVARFINWPPSLEEIGFPRKDNVVGYALQAIAKLNYRVATGQKAYTGAYMLHADNTSEDKATYTFQTVLLPLWDAGWFLLEAPTRLQDVHHWLTRFHGVGGFMAYEIVTDLRHTRYLRNAPDIDSWANAGPGAVRGLNRLLNRDLKASMRQPEANEWMQQLLHLAKAEPDALSISLHDMGLEMRDIEHSLCEFDKYERVRLGQGTPRAKYRPPSS